MFASVMDIGSHHVVEAAPTLASAAEILLLLSQSLPPPKHGVYEALCGMVRPHLL